MDRRVLIEDHVPSDIDYVGQFLSNAMEKIRKHVIDEDLIFDIRLIIDELVVNGAQHGNEWNSSKKVFLKVDMDREKMMISVRDEGIGMNYSTDQFDCKEMKCSGRGLLIVEALTDVITYNGNQICCTKYLLNKR